MNLGLGECKGKVERNAGNTKGGKECCGLFNMKVGCFLFASQSMQRQLTNRGYVVM